MDVEEPIVEQTAPAAPRRSAWRACGTALTWVLAVAVGAGGAGLYWRHRQNAPTPETAVPASAHVRQWDVRTCGPASLATLLNAYRRPWTRKALEAECRVTAHGCSAADLLSAARAHGLRAEALQALDEPALLRVPRPFIAFLTVGHFVVVERYAGGKLQVFDPTSGTVQAWSVSYLYARGGGVALRVGR